MGRWRLEELLVNNRNTPNILNKKISMITLLLSRELCKHGVDLMWKRIMFAFGVVVPPGVSIEDFSRLRMLVLSQGIPVFTFQMSWKAFSGWLEWNRGSGVPMFHKNAAMDVSRRYLPVSYSFCGYTGGKPKDFSL